MRVLFSLILFTPLFIFSQTNEAGKNKVQDSLPETILVRNGEGSIPTIDLEEVKVLHKLAFKDNKAHLRYLILQRKTLKVYPYAKMAADRLDSLTQNLGVMKRKREKKKYAKSVQKFIEEEFSEELKKLTRTEGQILIKLIHRQTGKTAFTLVKELRNGWRAFWYNNTASLFNISLKEEFNPIEVKQDYLIEDILQRAFNDDKIEKQKSFIPFDFFELVEKWKHKK